MYIILSRALRRMASDSLALGLALLMALTIAATASAAEPSYPSKPVRLIIPFAPGSTADIVGRLLAERLSVRLGQAVVVENKSGAGGVIGVDAVAKAPADGHTLLVTTSSTIVINPSLYKKLPHDVGRDFVPIARLGSLPAVLVATPGLPVGNVADLIQYARKNPGKLSYASNGLGSYAHVMMELLKHSTGIQIEHVPYRGGSSADTDLLAGNVHLMFNSLAAASPLVESGRLKALAVSSAQRSPFAPGVAGMGESGSPDLRDYDVSYWVGILAPAGTPTSVVRTLNTEITEWLQTAEAKQKLVSRKIQPAPPASPEDFSKDIRAETPYWSKVLKDAGVEPQSL